MKTWIIATLAMLSICAFAGPAAAGPTDQQCDGGVQGCVFGYLPYWADRFLEDPSLQYLGFGVEKFCNGIVEGDTCF